MEKCGTAGDKGGWGGGLDPSVMLLLPQRSTDFGGFRNNAGGCAHHTQKFDRTRHRRERGTDAGCEEEKKKETTSTNGM